MKLFKFVLFAIGLLLGGQVVAQDCVPGNLTYPDKSKVNLKAGVLNDAVLTFGFNEKCECEILKGELRIFHPNQKKPEVIIFSGSSLDLSKYQAKLKKGRKVQIIIHSYSCYGGFHSPKKFNKIYEFKIM